MEKIKILSILLFAYLFTACGDMNSVYQEYLDRGESIYIGIADSLTIIPGNHRAKIRWKLDADPKLKDCVISWGDSDSAVFEITRTSFDPEWMEVEVSNLPEGSLIFTAYTRDIYGNCSLKKEKSQKIYGEKYIQNLSFRKVSSIDVYSPNRLVMNWSAMENSVGVNFHYININNKKVDLFIAPNETEVTLTDFVMGGEYSYETLYVPVVNCIDTFSTVSKVDNFPDSYILDKSTWKVIDLSSEETASENSPAINIIDNDPNTYWHNVWSSETPILPHFITVDMQTVKKLKSITIAKRLGNTDLKKAHIELSMDNINWKKVGEVEFIQSADPNSDVISLLDFVEARYLKLVITESYRTPHTSVSEIYVTGLDQ